MVTILVCLIDLLAESPSLGGKDKSISGCRSPNLIPLLPRMQRKSEQEKEKEIGDCIEVSLTAWLNIILSLILWG